MGPHQFTYRKDQRLRVKEDFNYLREQRGFLKEKNLIFFYKKSRVGSSYTRMAFSVSRKIGKAHRRNRYKRLLKEAFRKSAFVNLGCDVLLVIRPEINREKDSVKREEKLLLSFNRLFTKVKESESYNFSN